MNRLADAKDFHNRSGKAVYNLRSTKRVTLRELAKITGVSSSTISRFENGKEISSMHYVLLTSWLLDTSDEEVKK